MSGHTVTIPDDQAFASFKAECLCEEGWSTTYNKGIVTVLTQVLEEGKSIHKIKVRKPDRYKYNFFREFLSDIYSSIHGNKWKAVWIWSCSNSTKGKGRHKNPAA